MSWSEHGYPGGPMVAVAGFPRPLYPPDAAPGHEPSCAGPDVEAYKRTVSRAGRWRWQAFDQSYSNAFAHGKGDDVAESGIAGVQAQGSPQLDPTGWVGERTFNLLRSIRIPAGLPHAGEPAMDARAVELINVAYARFQGEAKPEPPAGSSASARLALARTQLGVTEQPPNSNQCLYSDWYGAGAGPWCAMFVTYCDQESVSPTATFTQGSAYAYVPYIVSDARLGLYGLTVTDSPQPGDLVCFDWGWDGEYDHVGLVDIPPDESGDFGSLEGNTSPEGSSGSQSNGGEVCARRRNQYAQGTVFVRVAE